MTSHGGHIDLISEYGVGSTFFFDLDIIHDDSAEKVMSTEADISTIIELSSAAPPANSLKLHRALIVDDSQLNRKLMRKLLTNYFDCIDEVESLYFVF